MGALKVAAIPAAAPQATKIRRRAADIFTSLPMAEPMAEPICTIGPSRPTEPPEPIQIAEANALAKTIRVLILPSFKATDSITSGTPCPLASWAKK